MHPPLLKKSICLYWYIPNAHMRYRKQAKVEGILIPELGMPLWGSQNNLNWKRNQRKCLMVWRNSWDSVTWKSLLIASSYCAGWQCFLRTRQRSGRELHFSTHFWLEKKEIFATLVHKCEPRWAVVFCRHCIRFHKVVTAQISKIDYWN